jgi:hypothetical protein
MKVKKIISAAQPTIRKINSVFLLLACPLSLSAAQWYVTENANDNAGGAGTGTSLGSSWSVAEYNATAAPTGGDTVHFSGTINSTIVPNSSGTSSARLTLDLSGAAVSGPGGTDDYIFNNGQSYITYSGGGTWSNGVFTPGGSFGANSANSGPGTDGPTIFDLGSESCHDITITGCYYNGGSLDCTDFVYGETVYNLTVDRNKVVNGCHLGLGCSTGTHDLTFQYNFFQTSINTNTQTDVINWGDAYNMTIQGNVLINQAPNNQTLPSGNPRHNDVIQTYEKGGANAGNPYNWIVRYNWICNNSQPTSDGSGSWMMMENMTNNGSTAACYIYGNVFIDPTNTDNTNEGIVFDSNNSGTVVYLYNNTVIAHGEPFAVVLYFDVGSGSNTVYAENNACEADFPNEIGTFIISSFNNNWNHNWFCNFNNTGASYGAYTGPNGSDLGNGLTADPWFANYAGTSGSQLPSGYNLSSATGSPLRNAGDSTIGSAFNQGIAFGATWPNPALVTRSSGSWDVGAYQFAANSVSFTEQPASAMEAPGSTASFAVAAIGNPAPTYQWQKNSANIAGATGETLQLANVSSSSAGTYTAIATNSSGSVASKGAVLTIATLPMITSQPASQSITLGTNVTLVVSATGNPTPTYQWQKNGVNLSDSSGVTGSESPTLLLSEISSVEVASYKVEASNMAGTATSNAAVLSITVPLLPLAPSITSAKSESATVGSAFSYSITATNLPTSFTASGLPSGLSLKASTGVISGTPTAAGTFTVTMGASNLGGSGTAQLSLAVAGVHPAPVITSATSASAAVGSSFQYSIAASNWPTSFSAPGLPAGLSINTSTGVISGTPTAAGTSSVTIGASNASGTGTAKLAIAVSVHAVPVITSATSESAAVGSSFQYTIAANNWPTSFSAPGLPAGLSINATTGVISGTPTAAGTSSVTIGATNASGTGTAKLAITVTTTTHAMPAITSAASESATLGVAFKYSIVATNAPTGYWAAGLPEGLSLNTTTGVISGTPTTAGTFNASIGASNANGTVTTKLAITVGS